MKKKPITPKLLHVRLLANGRISVGEYTRAKWYNVVDPFRPDDKDSVRGLVLLIDHYKAKHKRDVDFVAYGGGAGVDTLRKAIEDARPVTTEST